MSFLFYLILILLSGCDVSRQGEYYPMNITDLTLSASNHPHGYSKAQCYSCHIPHNLHLTNRLGHPSFDYARSNVEANGIQSCSGCHGTNGVIP